jgi:hypothetical protein
MGVAVGSVTPPMTTGVLRGVGDPWERGVADGRAECVGRGVGFAVGTGCAVCWGCGVGLGVGFGVGRGVGVGAGAMTRNVPPSAVAPPGEAMKVTVYRPAVEKRREPDQTRLPPPDGARSATEIGPAGPLIAACTDVGALPFVVTWNVNVLPLRPDVGETLGFRRFVPATAGIGSAATMIATHRAATTRRLERHRSCRLRTKGSRLSAIRILCCADATASLRAGGQRDNSPDGARMMDLAADLEAELRSVREGKCR